MTAPTLRLVSWNVRDLTGDPLVVHRVLRELAPDVACLQEVPRRAGSGLRLRGIARGAGLVVVEGGRSAGGTAVLVREGVRVEAVRAVRLPVEHWHTRRRGAVLARVRRAGAAVTVASVHLPLSAHRRVRHAELVCAALERFGAGPWVVAGDLNETPDGDAWRAFSRLVADPAPASGPTFPARGPDRRIDAVLVSEGLVVTDYRVPALPADLVARASDHWPVVAEMAPAVLS